MLKLNITKQVLKFFRPLPANQYRQVFNKILALMEEPEPPDSSPLVGYPYRSPISGNTGLPIGLKQIALKWL